jgi:hypothetical protein
MNRVAWTLLFVVGFFGLGAPLYVPSGQAWTLAVRIAAGVLISLPAGALLVWLNGRPPGRQVR